MENYLHYLERYGVYAISAFIFILSFITYKSISETGTAMLVIAAITMLSAGVVKMLEINYSHEISLAATALTAIFLFIVSKEATGIYRYLVLFSVVLSLVYLFYEGYDYLFGSKKPVIPVPPPLPPASLTRPKPVTKPVTPAPTPEVTRQVSPNPSPVPVPETPEIMTPPKPEIKQVPPPGIKPRVKARPVVK